MNLDAALPGSQLDCEATAAIHPIAVRQMARAFAWLDAVARQGNDHTDR